MKDNTDTGKRSYKMKTIELKLYDAMAASDHVTGVPYIEYHLDDVYDYLEEIGYTEEEIEDLESNVDFEEYVAQAIWDNMTTKEWIDEGLHEYKIRGWGEVNLTEFDKRMKIILTYDEIFSISLYRLSVYKGCYDYEELLKMIEKTIKDRWEEEYNQGYLTIQKIYEELVERKSPLLKDKKFQGLYEEMIRIFSSGFTCFHDEMDIVSVDGRYPQDELNKSLLDEIKKYSWEFSEFIHFLKTRENIYFWRYLP